MPPKKAKPAGKGKKNISADMPLTEQLTRDNIDFQTSTAEVSTRVLTLMRENERVRTKYALLQEELDECQNLLALE